MKIKKLEPSCNLLIVHENLNLCKKYHSIKNISLKIIFKKWNFQGK